MQAEPESCSSSPPQNEVEQGPMSLLCHHDHELGSCSQPSTLSSPPTSLPLDPSQQDDFLSSISTELYFPLKPKKTVSFDESKNIIFAYNARSAIVPPQVCDEGARTEGSDDDEKQETIDYGVDLHDIGYKGGVSGRRRPSRFRRTWSLGMPGGLFEPIPLDLVAAVSSHDQPTLMLRPDQSGSRAEEISEEDSNSSFESNQANVQETWMSIASSMERSWASSRSQSYFSESEVKHSNSALPPMVSSPPLASTSRLSSGVHKAPTLKRQSSMSIIENGDSSESSGRETPPQPPAQLRRQVVEDAEAAVAPSSQVLQNQAEKEDTTTQDDSLWQQVGRVRLMSPPPSRTPAAGGERKVVRAFVRSREGPARTHSHPYKRRTPAVGTDTAAASSSSSSAPFVPPRLARAASFSVARQPARGPPMLRREASTTALMDTMS